MTSTANPSPSSENSTECPAYKCKGNEKCVMKKDKHQRGCQHCRYLRCLQIGMTPNSVLSKSRVNLDEDGDNSLNFLLKCKKANFIVRGNCTLAICGGPKYFQNMSNQLKTAMSCRNAIKAENVVLPHFIRTLGIATAEEPDFLNQLTFEFLPTWIVTESLFMTVRNRGFRTGRCYYLDGSYLLFNEDFVDRYYRQYGGSFDPTSVSRLGFELYTKLLQVAEKIHATRMSEQELITIQLILLLQTAMRISRQPQFFRKKLNDLWTALRQYYQSNFEDIALRIGNLMLNLELVQETKRAQDVAFMVQHVCDAGGNLQLEMRPFIHEPPSK
ncbi:hypothetical protein M3Y99_01123300 [Aphelenchoides fujianensis]|nr:hypothetical protein M3Y99_01123300 [Aphelenchoides fujianensis]